MATFDITALITVLDCISIIATLLTAIQIIITVIIFPNQYSVLILQIIIEIESCVTSFGSIAHFSFANNIYKNIFGICDKCVKKTCLLNEIQVLAQETQD